MAASDRSAALAVALLALTAGACASSPPQPVTLSPQTLSTPTPTSPSAPPVAPTQTAPPSVGDERAKAVARGEAVVIEDAPETPPEDIVAAAQAERTRRQEAGLPVAVITDKNLAEYASGALTFQETGSGETESGEPAAVEAAAALARTQRDEEYWRSEALAVRTRWREAYDEARELELQAADLRQRFYAEDDPFVRDGQIKPEWDRTLDRLEDAKERAAEERRALEHLLEEGRRAGAFPGWLREGEDIEPESGNGDQVESAAPNEPTVAEEHEVP